MSCLGGACAEPAYVIVSVRAGPAVGSDATSLRIVTINEEDSAAVFDAVFTVGEGEGELPPLHDSEARFTLLPAEDHPRFHLRVDLLDAAGDVLASASADGEFPSEGGEELNLAIGDACRHIRCDPGETCVEGGGENGVAECVSSCLGLLPIGTGAESRPVECECTGRPDGSPCATGRCWQQRCCDGCGSAEGGCVALGDMDGESCGWGGRECSSCGCGDACGAEGQCVVREPAGLLDVGDEHSCARTNSTSGAAERVFCWGQNENYELSDGSTEARLQPVLAWEDPPDGLAALAVGDDATCAVSQLGRISCWGLDDQSGLPFVEGDQQEPFESADPANTGFTRSLAMGTRHGCITKTVDGDVRLHCWGSNWVGQFGLGDEQLAPVPVEVPLPPGNTNAIAADRRNTCAIIEGKLYCMGQNGQGQVGVRYTTSTAIERLPVAAFEGTSFADYSWTAIGIHGQGCGIDNHGAHHCWGNQPAVSQGLCSGGSDCLAFSGVPYSVDGPPAAEIAVGFHHCIISDAGGLYCYGDPELNGVQRTRVGSPDRVGPLGWKWHEVRVGLNSSCALREDGTVWCWGRYTSGQVGERPPGAGASTSAPVRMCFRADAQPEGSIP